MSSCLRAVVGVIAARIAGRGAGMRISLAGLRIRLSAVALSRSHSNCYLECGSRIPVIGWASRQLPRPEERGGSHDPTEMIQKDERGYYRTWYCGICGNSFKNRDLNIRDASFGDDVGSRALQDAVVHTLPV